MVQLGHKEKCFTFYAEDINLGFSLYDSTAAISSHRSHQTQESDTCEKAWLIEKSKDIGMLDTDDGYKRKAYDCIYLRSHLPRNASQIKETNNSTQGRNIQTPPAPLPQPYTPSSLILLRTSTNAFPSKFCPHRSPFSFASFSVNPIPQILSAGLASTSSLSPVSINHSLNCAASREIVNL
jgi:hypothetical protein